MTAFPFFSSLCDAPSIACRLNVGRIIAGRDLEAAVKSAPPLGRLPINRMAAILACRALTAAFWQEPTGSFSIDLLRFHWVRCYLDF